MIRRENLNYFLVTYQRMDMMAITVSLDYDYSMLLVIFNLNFKYWSFIT